MSISRREILSTTGGALIGASAGALVTYFARRLDEGPEDVSAPEDLMREHGVLNRILLVYEEGLRRLAAKRDVPADAFRSSADLVRRFVEDYHERLEEKFIFPEFEKQKRMEDLVRVLRTQHQAGR